MKIHNGQVESLSDELFLLQMENILNSTAIEISSLHHETKHKMLVAFAPFTITALLYLLTEKTEFFAIGATYVGGCAIVNLIKDAIKEHREYLISHDPNLIKLHQDNPYHPNTSFYTSKDFIKEEIKNKPFELNDNEVSIPPYVFFNLDDVKNRLTFEYNVLNGVYELPPITISDTEWESIYSLFSNELQDKTSLDELYEEINKTLRLTIAYCLLNKCPSISLKEFIYILEYRSKVSKSPLNYQVIADELNAFLPPTTIIDLKPLLAKKKEKNL